MRLLLAEDDELLGEAVVGMLQADGHSVDWAKTGVEAEHFIPLYSYDAIILDIGLPQKSGLEVLTALRAQANNTPVLILTALGEVEQRIEGLDLGADDYLVKPFDLFELLARLRATVRRSAGGANNQLTAVNIVLDAAARRVVYCNEIVDLSIKEFNLLHKLMLQPGRVYSQQALFDHLYDNDSEVASNTVQVHIHGLRKKLHKSVIKTIRGEGYVLAQN